MGTYIFMVDVLKEIVEDVYHLEIHEEETEFSSLYELENGDVKKGRTNCIRKFGLEKRRKMRLF